MQIETMDAARKAAVSMGINPDVITPFSPSWTAPTPDDIRAVLKAGNLTGSAAAHLVGVDSRTIRKWTGGERAIPYAAFALLLSVVGCGEVWKLK